LIIANIPLDAQTSSAEVQKTICLHSEDSVSPLDKTKIDRQRKFYYARLIRRANKSFLSNIRKSGRPDMKTNAYPKANIENKAMFTSMKPERQKRIQKALKNQILSNSNLRENETKKVSNRQSRPKTNRG